MRMVATTSLNVDEAEILSIAAVRIRGSRVLTSERLDIRLKPPASLGADSIKIHKLRAADLADGMEIDEALRLVLDFVGNRPILGYYVSFDVRMLDKYLRPRYGRKPTNTAFGAYGNTTGQSSAGFAFGRNVITRCWLFIIYLCP